LTDRAVRLWPTPVARDDQKSPEAHLAMKARMPGGPRKGITSLTVAVKAWPTPQARDGKGPFPGHRQGGRDLPGQATAFRSGHPTPTTGTPGRRSPSAMVLNPPWVEWLMGWPIGWTDCARSATASYRSWQRTHSSALHNALASSTTG
jgi:hypothetical protein